MIFHWRTAGASQNLFQFFLKKYWLINQKRPKWKQLKVFRTKGHHDTTNVAVLVEIISNLNSLFSGTLCIYEKGLIFIHQRYGPVSIPLSTLSAMHFYDKESSSLPTLLILTYMPSLVDHLPCHLVNDSHRVVVMISPRTKIFRQFYSDVLHLWKAEGSQPQLQIISGISHQRKNKIFLVIIHY